MEPLLGIHHITALASDPQRNADFYLRVLGLRLVKQTVNFDSPDVYHLYYGDGTGSPGTLLTFFPFVHAARGTRGSGEIASVAYSVPASATDFWIRRLSSQGITFDGPTQRFDEEVISFPDPDGMIVELVFKDGVNNSTAWAGTHMPHEFALGAFHGATFWLSQLEGTEQFMRDTMRFRRGSERGNSIRYHIGSGRAEAAIEVVVKKNLPPGRQSAGSVHHIAWRVASDDGHRQWRKAIMDHNRPVTEIIDRQYFHSIYFREPGGILFEIATDPPGFTVDEPFEKLGTSLRLPPWLEAHRKRIEQTLPPLNVSYNMPRV